MVAQAEVADGTVLMDACRRNHAAVVASVLKAGANTEMRDRAYKTALMVAAEHGSADCARVLLLAVRAPLRAAIVVTIAYADSGGKSSPAEVHGARQRRSPSSPPATAPSPP